ncbi:MAG TPA: (2Fe-2S)-binding protein [Micromonosporaceae bacterium]|nr:(2Fe-2S)-binding protein [Micromonosporaceae bacterium]
MDTQRLRPVPASWITDAAWLDRQIDAAGRRYRLARRPALGVLWWYSASSVLLGPPVESLAGPGAVADPDLAGITLFVHPDGRILDARSESALHGDFGPRLAGMLSASIGAVATVTGAARRALWAIATDALANRVLWAGGSPEVAERIAASVGPVLPVPRYVEVSGRLVVRRASCCLVYEAPGIGKCTSCPRQTPEDRFRRLCDGM